MERRAAEGAPDGEHGRRASRHHSCAGPDRARRSPLQIPPLNTIRRSPPAPAKSSPTMANVSLRDGLLQSQGARLRGSKDQSLAQDRKGFALYDPEGPESFLVSRAFPRFRSRCPSARPKPASRKDGGRSRYPPAARPARRPRQAEPSTGRARSTACTMRPRHGTSRQSHAARGSPRGASARADDGRHVRGTPPSCTSA